MSIGMTYDEFWNQDVLLVKYYKEAFVLKQQRMDESAWLQGVYVYEALIKVSPILHAFAKAGTKPQPYSEKPYGIFEKETQNQIDAKAKAKKEEAEKQLEIEKTQWFFKNWVASFSEKK